jgi:hypothetical protein
MLGVVVVVVCVLLVSAVQAASAVAVGPRWQVSLTTAPRNLPPGGEGEVAVLASNVGREPVRVVAPGSPVTLDIHLPGGLSAVGLAHEPFVGYLGRQGIENGLLVENTMTCNVVSGSLVQCEWAGERDLPSHEVIEIRLIVKVAVSAASGEEDEVTVEGGEAPAVATRSPVVVSDEPTPFGVEEYDLTAENEDGTVDTQAGSHPYSLTSTIAFNSSLELHNQSYGVLPSSPALTRDLHFALPAGLLGNPTLFAQCTEEQFDTKGNSGTNVCPPEAAIGVVSLTASDPATKGAFTILVPLFNVTPGSGEPARFGFRVENVPVFLDTSVRTGGDYGVTVNIQNIAQAANFISSRVTFWGVPGDPSHDAERGWGCINLAFSASNLTCSKLELPQQPLLTLPTSCTGPLQTSVEGDSWPTTFDPTGLVLPKAEPASTESLQGCERLRLEPEVAVAPDGASASTPSGLTATIHIPQEGSLVPTGLAESAVKDTTVALPEGVTLNPSGAGGLEACSEVQAGFQGVEADGTDLFSAQAPSCPDASKVGTAKIKSPLLPNPLEGSLYLATQDENPFGSLIAMYLVVRDPVSGVLVKAAGEVALNQATGQIVTTFANTPQLPYEELQLHLFGGERAPLSTPPLCGGYTTAASFTPWSGTPPVAASSEFKITSGANGGPCQSPQPFAPGFSAGTSNIQAGAFTPFAMTISRPDADQALGGISLHMPPGLSGMLSSVKLCEEPQAATGTCGPESLIGRTTVSAGLGNAPYTVEGGKVFITGPTAGAPFGLSIVDPAVAGPFNLGTVVVRAKIEIDPRTAALTVTTTGPLPTILQGIPLQLQHVNVTIERQGFTFNPTSCDKLSLTGTITSSAGASANVSSPFQVTNCKALAFKPTFAVSTSGRTSRLNGASLDVKVTYPKALQGSEANLAKARVELPKRLPSRLKTLQKACTEAEFAANPATCPATSRVGQAVVHTPVLPVALVGPAYFVSHGGAKFPELILVLQGDGVTIELHGETAISKKGVTTSTFAQTPDVPFSSFELKLPEGPYSALAANGNLCKGQLVMPTELVAQNGTVIKQKTKISVSGCAKRKTKTKEGSKRADSRTKGGKQKR